MSGSPAAEIVIGSERCVATVQGAAATSMPSRLSELAARSVRRIASAEIGFAGNAERGKTADKHQLDRESASRGPAMLSGRLAGDRLDYDQAVLRRLMQTRGPPARDPLR